jgi:hypothetical protein
MQFGVGVDGGLKPRSEAVLQPFIGPKIPPPKIAAINIHTSVF